MPVLPTPSTAALRQQNHKRVYDYFYTADAPQTKQDVAAALVMSLPTVTQNLRELMDAGLLQYVGTVDSTGGRKPRTMALVASARFSVGIELSPKHIRLVAVDLKVREIAFQCIECRFSDDLAYRTQLASILESFLDAFALDRSRLLGVGLTLPGIISENADFITVAPVLQVSHMRLEPLTQNIPYPVFVQNDASAGGFAEWWNRSDLSSMAYLFIGKGVGGALLIDGKPYAGVHRRSAEFGHMCVVPGGAPCSCGQRGCLEAYCSTARLTEDFDIRIEDFFEGLQQGSAQYCAAWERYLDHLASGINTIRMVMDCDVVIGGLLTPFLVPYLPALRRRLCARSSFADEGDYLHLGKCETKANCIGVALHFIDAFLRRDHSSSGSDCEERRQ